MGSSAKTIFRSGNRSVRTAARTSSAGQRVLPWLKQRLAARQTIEISEKAGVRYLHFSSKWVQGAMRVQNPDALELPYTREMMAGVLLREPPWPRQALLIGLGAGSLAKFIYHQLPATRITVVEIDAQVEVVARSFFHLPEDRSRLRVVIADGAQYLREVNEDCDYLLVDGFDGKARAGALESLEFYQACRQRLSASGLLVANLLGREEGFAASIGRLEQAFDARVLTFPSGDGGNIIALASSGEPVDVTSEELSERASRWRDAHGLNLLPTVARLRSARAFAGGRLRI